MPEKKAAKPKPEVEVYDVSALLGKNRRTFAHLWGDDRNRNGVTKSGNGVNAAICARRVVAA